MSSEAGGQEREALERLRSYLAVAPIGSLFDRSTQMLLRDVLAALDAANSRVEEAEAETERIRRGGDLEKIHNLRAALEEAERKAADSEKWGQEGWDWLDAALNALGAKTVFDIKAAEDRIRELEAALGAMRSNAEGWAREEARAERLELQRQTHVQMLDDAQKLEAALREIGQHPARYGIDASDFALDALSQATKREGP